MKSLAKRQIGRVYKQTATRSADIDLAALFMDRLPFYALYCAGLSA